VPRWSRWMMIAPRERLWRRPLPVLPLPQHRLLGHDSHCYVLRSEAGVRAPPFHPLKLSFRRRRWFTSCSFDVQTTKAEQAALKISSISSTRASYNIIQFINTSFDTHFTIYSYILTSLQVIFLHTLLRWAV